MAVSRQRRNIAYGFNQPLSDISPEPITSNRAPTTLDRAEIGTPWVRKSTNAAWILASVVANVSTWTPTTVNAGATITTGNLTVVAGNINVTAGDIAITTGDMTIGTGDITLSAGDFVSTAGNIEAVSCYATGAGGGIAASVGISGITDTTLSTGAGVVLMKTGNPGDSSGWLQIYVGTDIRYIPFWTNLSP